MKIIGITGASGSGKTTISQILNQRQDTKVIDADKMAKQMTTNLETEYFLAIKKAFEKEQIISKDGTLNRAQLAQLIYHDENNLKKLNQITFRYLIPKIINEIKCVSAEIEWIIIDAPLLFEAGLEKYCDVTIALDVPERLKINRICKRDKITEKVAKERLHIQKDNEFYKQKSDYVIMNDENTTIQDLEQKINEILKESICHKTAIS